MKNTFDDALKELDSKRKMDSEKKQNEINESEQKQKSVENQMSEAVKLIQDFIVALQSSGIQKRKHRNTFFSPSGWEVIRYRDNDGYFCGSVFLCTDGSAYISGTRIPNINGFNEPDVLYGRKLSIMRAAELLIKIYGSMPAIENNFAYYIKKDGNLDSI